MPAHEANFRGAWRERRFQFHRARLSRQYRIARALDVAELRSLKAEKRYALAVLFIQAQLQKALDDVAGIFIKVVRKFESYAKGPAAKIPA